MVNRPVELFRIVYCLPATIPADGSLTVCVVVPVNS